MSEAQIALLNERISKLDERLKKIEVRYVGTVYFHLMDRRMIQMTILKHRNMCVTHVLKVE